MPPMRRLPAHFPCCAAVGALLLLSLFGTGSADAASFNTATVTKVERDVFLGERDENKVRPAAANDVMQARNFLTSKSDSRAELQYPDGTVVRVGQNTVFTFDAGSRTLSLKDGSLLFHIPK